MKKNLNNKNQSLQFSQNDLKYSQQFPQWLRSQNKILQHEQDQQKQLQFGDHQQQYQQHLVESQRQNLLSKHPNILNKLICLNKKKQDVELLQFIISEQNIMNGQLVKIKIPDLQSAINNLKQKIRNQSLITKQKQERIEQTREIIEKVKCALLECSIKSRELKQKQAVLAQTANKLKQPLSIQNQKVPKGRVSSRQKKQIHLKPMNQNKENSNTNNTTKTYKIQQIKQNSQYMDTLKKVQLRSNNKVLEQKINRMREQIKGKYNKLEQIKKQKKRLIELLKTRTKPRVQQQQIAIEASQKSVVLSEDQSIQF